MKLHDKIYIAGHRGLVGSAIVKKLRQRGFKNLLLRTRSELDLINQSDVNAFFQKEKPDYVILAAAKVGGIHANNTFPAEFIYQNILIQANVINSSFENNVKRLMFLGSSCIYPREAKQPMQEKALLTGLLEPTNEPYALAKIAGIKLCESYNRQYDTDFRSVMPTNLYGINDNFNDKNSHVIPALISRFHKAKINNDNKVKVWGTGKAMREFMFSDDMADATLFIFELDKEIINAKNNIMLSHINIGTGEDITIKDLAETIKEVVGFEGNISFDTSKSDGPDRKLLDVSRLSDLGWRHSINITDGLVKTYKWFLAEEKK